MSGKRSYVSVLGNTCPLRLNFAYLILRIRGFFRRREARSPTTQAGTLDIKFYLIMFQNGHVMNTWVTPKVMTPIITANGFLHLCHLSRIPSNLLQGIGGLA